MVLKRKRGEEFLPYVSSSEPSSAPIQVPKQEAQTTRSNPPRSVRSQTAAVAVAAPEAPPAKKARAPRGKKATTTAPTTISSISSASQAGPSSIPEPTPVLPKRGKGKKKAVDDPETSQPEKRGAVFKPKCPQNILDRVERTMTQRIFMIDRQRNDGELREQFSVLGSTGNVYTVTIDKTPRCNCPDACKGNHCKHILFVFLKVLQVTRESGLWYQKALLTSELEQIFANAPLAPNSVAHPHIREAYARATGKIPADAPADAGKKNRRIPGPDDDCPICYDGMHGAAETSLIFCEECGNALHKECFQQWQRTAKSSGKELTCVWCRAKWVVAGGGAGTPIAKRTMGGYGYLNLAGTSGVSPVRDTSTYYHGPRRGQRYYGYQDYE